MKGWKLFVAGILLGLLLSGLFRLVRIPDNAQSFTLVTTTPDLTPKPSPTLSQIKVHVAGEVKVPGVYTLPDGATIQDAIEVAQGPTQKARADLLNLAAPLTDGQRIYIPSAEDEQSAQDQHRKPGEYQYCQQGRTGEPARDWKRAGRGDYCLSYSKWLLFSHRRLDESRWHWSGDFRSLETFDHYLAINAKKSTTGIIKPWIFIKCYRMIWQAP